MDLDSLSTSTFVGKKRNSSIRREKEKSISLRELEKSFFCVEPAPPRKNYIDIFREVPSEDARRVFNRSGEEIHSSIPEERRREMVEEYHSLGLKLVEQLKECHAINDILLEKDEEESSMMVRLHNSRFNGGALKSGDSQGTLLKLQRHLLKLNEIRTSLFDKATETIYQRRLLDEELRK